MVAEMLRANGYAVLAAADGVKALELSEGYSGRIDLLLTDMIMPGLNGKALYDKIKASRPDINVLFMSGYTNNLISSDLKPGSDLGFIQKPFTSDKLEFKLRSIFSAK